MAKEKSKKIKVKKANKSHSFLFFNSLRKAARPSSPKQAMVIAKAENIPNISNSLLSDRYSCLSRYKLGASTGNFIKRHLTM